MNEAALAFERLRKYCQLEDFKGWDPYDGLNSKIFQALPFKNSALFRLCWIQFFKRSPINFRAILRVPKTDNAKGLALFIRGLAVLYRAFGQAEDLALIRKLVLRLERALSGGYSGICFGYPFDWQSRAFFVRRGTPNVIVSTFAGQALLDVYDLTGEKELLSQARSTCDFILKDLNRTPGPEKTFCFSYTPLDKSAIINASLLASQFLARVYSSTGEKALKEVAGQSVAFCCQAQEADGSWYYGLARNQRWIDSFHTAYNLEALYLYSRWSQDQRFKENFSRGLTYYLSKFFTKEGIPRYYNDKIYPIDIHSPASLVVFMYQTELFNEHKDLIWRVLRWTIEAMQSKIGYFFYQKKKFFTAQVPYMRWAEGWMFYALGCYLAATEGKGHNESKQ
jgi:hypothetical protein